MEKLNTDGIKVLLGSIIDKNDEILTALMQDSDEEEDILLAVLPNRKKRKSVRDFMKAIIPTYSENEFRTHFRVKKLLFESLTEKFSSSEIHENLHADKRCSASKHIAVFLWFAGHKACSFRDLADRFDISVSTVSEIIHRTTMFISSLSPNIIKWPNEEQKLQSCSFFKNKSGFPNAIGCIDGTHIVFDPPPVCKYDYVDRKGCVSVCLQAICNENKKFINTFVGYPGSSHDSWVFQNTPIHDKLNTACGDYYLLGDSAYQCTNHLVTPYRDNGHLTRAQKNFNVKLTFSRVAIEHSFSILMQRFPQLYYCKLRGIENICHFVRACCVLHNMADEDDLEFSLENIHETSSENVQFEETARENSVRDAICQELQLNPCN